MFINCVGAVLQVPDSIRDLEALQLWLKDGTLLRWAVVSPKRSKVVVFATPEGAADGAMRGGWIVPLRRMEKDASDLLAMINEAIENEEAIHV